MNCPYCEKEMKKGIISGDGRSGVYWKAGEKRTDFKDKLGGTGKLKAVKYSLAVFEIQACYCPKCKKMIFDTEVSESLFD